ncbi:hypothetical protein HCJ76_10820 [Streptomyces sp. MC1]|uniref:restriction endonuclease subunit S n=1 Tax=Streptomyces sp. MC1 TaxID=295105 RepID=UPI0018CA17F6|nr:hypothetical protein [Streptomyces sp. MC1]MBG7698556.1 hypothetical protein [Streptomyces sp. MC1]
MTTIPGLGDVPSTWRAERAKWLLNRERRTVRPEDRIITAFRDGQVTLRDNRRTGGFTNAVQEIGYQGIRTGDLVVHGMDGFAGAIGVSDSDGKASPVVHAYQPSETMDARFIAYVLRTMALNGYVSTLAKGIRERSTAFDNATLANVILPAPPLTEQRQIADFLDAQTARIDQVSSLLNASLDLLQTRLVGVIDDELSKISDDMVPLKYWASVVDTEHKTAPYIPGGGYWVAGTSAVRGGDIVSRALYETDEASYKEWTRRRRPRPGDVLLSREAPVGEVALYRESDPQIAIGQRMVLITPDTRHLESEYLMWSLLSSDVKVFYELKTQGSLHPHLNMSDIGSIPIKRCDRKGQLGAVQRIRSEVAFTRTLRDARNAMRDLLVERRQALITAAVTGQFDVSTACGRNVTEGVAV